MQFGDLDCHTYGIALVVQGWVAAMVVSFFFKVIRYLQ